MLALAATGGVAQTPPQDPPPPSDGPIRRQVFETDQPLPEALRKQLKLPPGATFKDIPPGATRISPRAKRHFRALANMEAKVEAEAPAIADTVIASERLGLVQEAWQLDAPIKLRKPLQGEVPKGTVLVREVREVDGEELYCIARTTGVVFQPFVDERRAIYPALCLFDDDKDGSPDSYKAEPYRPENPVIVQKVGRPVAWTPLSAQSSSPHALGMTLTRQLKVEAVGAQEITLAAQLHILPRGAAKPMVSKVPDWRSVKLALRDGEQVVIDGITVRVAKVAGEWRLRSSGSFLPWAELRPDRTGYRILSSKVPGTEQ